MIDFVTPLAGLFLLSFSAATLLPVGSEAALLALAALGDYTLFTLLVVASVGNVLGSVVNYGVGRLALHYQDRRWFPVSPAALARSQGWFKRWGQWAVLLAWAPFIGDPITVAAGVMRLPFWRFFVLVTVSKTTRYVVVLGLFDLLW